jgi:hypothetical protein
VEKSDETVLAPHKAVTGEPEWCSLRQLLDQLTCSRPGHSPLFSDVQCALVDITAKIVAKQTRALVRNCAWEEGQMVARGLLKLLSPDVLEKFEFKCAPDGEWVLVEWGKNPFTSRKPLPETPGPAVGRSDGTVAVIHAYDEAQNGYVQVSLNAIYGVCDIQFRRDELMAAWPESEKTPAQTDVVKNEDRVQSTVAAEVRCRNWLLDLMAKESKPTKAKAEYMTDAFALFSVGQRAFLRAWGTAIAESKNENWSRPGRKS